jgi:hypothetical protein
MNSAEQVDYAAIIADLEAKRAALDATIVAFRSAMALGALGQVVEGLAATTAVPFSASGGEVPVGAFLGKSIPEAAKLCLAIVKKKQTTREIADALKKGGIESSARNFYSLVGSILDRSSKTNNGIVKLDRSHWALAEWYPASMRGSSPSEKRVEKRARKRRGGTKIKPGSITKVSDGPTTTSRISMVLKSKPGTEFTAEDIAPSAQVSLPVTRLTLGRLVASKQAEKTSGGKYRSIAAS